MQYEKPNVLRPGMFAGLKFDEGWWFIQAVGTEIVEYKPVVLQNENGNEAELAAGTAGVETDEIQDINNNLVLEPNDEDRNTVHQIHYGIAPSRMQVFNLFGRERNKALEDFDEPGDPAPILNGIDSPYNYPARQSETFYVNTQAPLRMQAFNPMDEPAEARLSFHVNKIRYTVVTDKGLMKAMLQGSQPSNLHMMGGGVQNKDQVDLPAWLNRAFGEHIYTTKEILEANGGSAADRAEENAATLEGLQ